MSDNQQPIDKSSTRKHPKSNKSKSHKQSESDQKGSNEKNKGKKHYPRQNKESPRNKTGDPIEVKEKLLDNDNTPGKSKCHKLPEMKFDQYISLEECSAGLKRGELIKGAIRINPRNFNDAFIDGENHGERDVYIEGVALRNRSLPGDIVAVKLLPEDKWKRSKPGEPDHKNNSDEVIVTKTGKVVYIIENKHSRVACGFLKPYRNNSFGFALLSPVDNRLPRLMIPLPECPKDFKSDFKNYEKTLFIGHIASWGKNNAFASGKLMHSLGEAGHIEPETQSILLCNDIDSSPFSEKVIACLPDGTTWKVTEKELRKRRDMRDECIFTIDPATARDLDDALSCKQLEDDIFEVGVHIADVSYFIEQGSELDKVAAERATSVYLAQKVIPMLPNVLCEQLCSLNPGVERLAYSVIWKMKSDGTVLSEWFGRTCIRSCMKLSYDHAQRMIDSSDDEELPTDEFPKIFGDYTLSKIVTTVKKLFNISKFLRSNRFDSGALRLDQPKLAFTLDDKTAMPNGCFVYQYKDSNRMIEEFMLLANMAVGQKTYKHHPDRAILRCHAPPQEVMIQDVADTCRKYNIPFDISNSSTISNSLNAVLRSESKQEAQTLFAALTLLCTKPFQNAKYFCTGSIENESAYRHYALNVPIYTHFTSPIRRYPDVLVHRLLTASLDKSFEVEGDVEQLQQAAEHCNDKKWAAKKASEQSSLLFFAVYLLECGPLTEDGVVVAVLDKAVDILCKRVGIVVRAYLDQVPLWHYQFTMEEGKPSLTLYWCDSDEDLSKDNKNIDEQIDSLKGKLEKKWKIQKEAAVSKENIPKNAIEQILNLFTSVSVVLSVNRDLPTKIVGKLLNPTIEALPSLQL